MQAPYRSHDDWLSRMQALAETQTVRKNVRRSGGWDLLWGCINMAIGGSMMAETLFGVVPFMLGLCLFGIGLFNLVRPAPVGYLIDGIAFVMLAALNGFVFLLTVVGGSPAKGAAFFTVIQVVCAASQFKKWNQAKHLPTVRETREETAHLDQAHRDLLTAAPHDPTIVEFQTANLEKRTNWRARLGQGFLVATDLAGAVYFVRAGELVIQPTGATLLSSTTLNARIGFRGEWLQGTLSADAMNRFNQWASAPAPLTYAPPNAN